MNYNSSRDHLLYTEYGRNIQELVEHALTIDEKEKRQEYVEGMVALIEQMHPQSRGITDGKIKLWKQIFAISDYKLDVDPPEGIDVSPTMTHLKPNILSYPNIKTRYRHYGQNVQHMIAKAIEMEDEEMKNEYLMVIGSYMKLAYRTWNREHYVSDDLIKGDMKLLSKGQVEMDPEISLDMLASSSVSMAHRRKPKVNERSGKNKRKSNNNNKRNHSKRNKRR